MTEQTATPSKNKVALITGSARRIGAYVAEYLHQHEYHIILHYRHSGEEAKALRDKLNQSRPHSCIALHADLSDPESWPQLAEQVLSWQHRLDLLVNNASSYYPTYFGETSVEQWNDLFASNAQAPFFLTQHLVDLLKSSNGSVINMTDAILHKSGPKLIPYAMAKTALRTMTIELAKLLAPEIRVNGVAPGVIIWPEHHEKMSEQDKQDALETIPMKRMGSPQDIAQTILFLAQSAPYITGQILAVDGGRGL